MSIAAISCYLQLCHSAFQNDNEISSFRRRAMESRIPLSSNAHWPSVDLEMEPVDPRSTPEKRHHETHDHAPHSQKSRAPLQFFSARLCNNRIASVSAWTGLARKLIYRFFGKPCVGVAEDCRSVPKQTFTDEPMPSVLCVMFNNLRRCGIVWLGTVALAAPSVSHAACNLDIDGNGLYDAATDGLCS